MKFSQKAFTLVELMIVIAIIGILAAALFPSLTGYLARSRDTVRISDISKVAAALRLYENDSGYMKMTASYGSYDQGGWDWSSQPNSNPQFMKFLVDGGYLTKHLKDPINDFSSTTCDPAWGALNCPGFAYFYYCYPTGATGINYPQFVLGARLEQPPSASGTNMAAGRIGGTDGKMYYFGRWNEGSQINNTVCQ